jgi:hypothetical protein
LKKQLREAQYEIIKLREEKRISEEGIMKHYKKCRPAIDDACATLSDAQSKLKRNAALLRQVRSLNEIKFVIKKGKHGLTTVSDIGQGNYGQTK